MILFAVPPKVCIGIVFNFSWGDFEYQEKQKTMLMQNIGGTIKSIVSRLSTIVRVNVVVSRTVVDSERVLWYF